jgi:hypothetical protein
VDPISGKFEATDTRIDLGPDDKLTGISNGVVSVYCNGVIRTWDLLHGTRPKKFSV